MTHDFALIEVLDALRHDLAKYLALPLRMLPRHASATDVLDALRRALLHTRSGPAGTLGARQVYAELRPELLRCDAAPAQLQRLDAALDRALAWHAALDAPPAELDRGRIEHDFLQVTVTLESWLHELRQLQGVRGE